MPNVGYKVLLRDSETGRITDDWDGEVHPTQSAANQSCIEAKQAGWDAFTVSLISRKTVVTADA